VAPRAAARLDGRAGRTLRSRQAICEACLDLVQEGVLQPTADQVAERAGLSRRSIFNHFADLAELYDAVFEAGMERCVPLLAEIPRDTPLARRVDAWIEARTRFLEATAPFTRALMAQALAEATSPQALRVSQRALRLQQRAVEDLFAADLATTRATARQETLEAISAATSPLLWEHLRHSRGLSATRARAVMQRSVEALLRDAGAALA
jgi:AcrR family transcriptional regulator